MCIVYVDGKSKMNVRKLSIYFLIFLGTHIKVFFFFFKFKSNIYIGLYVPIVYAT